MNIFDHSGNPLAVWEHGTSLAGKYLKYAKLEWLQMSGTDMTGANLYGAYMNNTLLRGCVLVGANLERASIAGPDSYISGVDFTGARRKPFDNPIPGWKVVDGLMCRRASNECSQCDETTDLAQCGDCDNHCRHSYCDHCSLCASNVCTHCEACDSCCSCDTCSNCGELSGDGCPSGDCSYCPDCCSCDSYDEDSDENEHGKPFVYSQNSKFNCPRMVGVEWEFNDMINLSAWKTKWRGGIHTDGSCGYEAVTPPIAGDHIAACLTDLGQRLEADGSCDNRCGIHVHVDAKDLKWADMYRLLWVYGKIEPILYLLAGQERSKGHYCKPVGKDYLKSLSEFDRKTAVLEIAIGSEDICGRGLKQYMRSRILEKKGAGRYRGLNIIPWIVGRAYPQKVQTVNPETGKKSTAFRPNSDTTVEFRMHKNTKKSTRVIGWAQLCARLVEWCANATDKEAQDLPKSALRALCQIIAPDLAPWILSRVKEWRRSTPTAKDYRSKRSRPIPRRISITENGYQLKVGGV